MSKEMKTLSIGVEEYEVVDEKARTDLSNLSNRLGEEVNTLNETITNNVSEINTLIDNLYIDTVLNMKQLTTLKNGDIVKTLGYASINDDGEGLYKIRTKTESDVEDNGSIHFLNNNLVAELIVTEKVSVKQFGAKGDGVTNDTAILRKAFEFASNNNFKCFIPKGTYIIAPDLSNTHGGNTYTYCFDVKSNFNIEGYSIKDTVLKVMNPPKSYTSIFCNYLGENYNNISIKNLTVQQDYDGESDNIVAGTRTNLKGVIMLYSPCEYITIENVYFKNCCGMNTVSINNDNTSNVVLNRCEFDYKYVRNSVHYDRSMVYMECHDYIVQNNIVRGNFEVLGGIELHGYNGLAFNNTIYECFTAMHIAPRFKSPIETASIRVVDNKFKDNAYSVKMWNNTHSQATKGCDGVIIDNNIIDINGSVASQLFWLSVGNHKPDTICGIQLNQDLEGLPLNDVKITNNMIVVHDGYSHKDSVTASAHSSGISLAGKMDVSNIIIANNTIDGMFGAGISMGSLINTIIKNATNVQIINNIIKNCGCASDTNTIYKAFISLKYGNKDNVIVKNNILQKTDTRYNQWASIYNQSNAECVHKNFYIVDNITETAGTDMTYSVNNGSNAIIDKGSTTNRPTTANNGDTYYDETIKKLILWNGTAWVNVDGSAIA